MSESETKASPVGAETDPTPVVESSNGLNESTNDVQTESAETESGSDSPVEKEKSKDAVIESYKESIRVKNNEAKGLRDKLKITESELASTKDTFTELQSKYDALIQSKQSDQLEGQVMELAKKLNAKTPAAVLKVIDRNNIVFTDDGIEGLEVEVQRVKAELPDLFHNTRKAVDAGAGQGKSPSSQSLGDLIRKQAGR